MVRHVVRGLNDTPVDNERMFCTREVTAIEEERSGIMNRVARVICVTLYFRIIL